MGRRGQSTTGNGFFFIEPETFPSRGKTAEARVTGGFLSSPALSDDFALTWHAFDGRCADRGPTAGEPKRRQTTGKRRFDYIPIERSAELIQAFIETEVLGCPLTAHLTITMDGSGSSLSDVQRATRIRKAVLKCVAARFKRVGHDLAFLYVLETAELGLHLHILLHIEPARWLEVKKGVDTLVRKRLDELGVRARLVTADGKPFNVLKITPPQGDGDEDAPAALEDRLRLLGYLLKGTDPLALVKTGAGPIPFANLLTFYLQSKIRSPGRIITLRRAGRSQNLGPKAREYRAPSLLEWVDRVNELSDETLRLPKPEVLATLIGPGSDEPTAVELLEGVMHLLSDWLLVSS